MGIIKRFTKINKGIQRSIIVLIVFGPFGLGVIYNLIDRNDITYDFMYYVLLAFLTIIFVTLITLWIYDGFKKEDELI